MTLSSNLLKELRGLNRVEKLQVMQILLNDLAAEEAAAPCEGAHYDVWSPFDSADAALELLRMLKEDQDA